MRRYTWKNGLRSIVISAVAGRTQDYVSNFVKLANNDMIEMSHCHVLLSRLMKGCLCNAFSIANLQINREYYSVSLESAFLLEESDFRINGLLSSSRASRITRSAVR